MARIGITKRNSKVNAKTQSWRGLGCYCEQISPSFLKHLQQHRTFIIGV